MLRSLPTRIQGVVVKRARIHRTHIGMLLTCLFAVQANGQGPVESFPHEESSQLNRNQVEALRNWFPAAFWAHRRFFFDDDMQMTIGPAHRDYGPPEVYRQATRRYHEQVEIGEDSTLLNYRAGQPFPMAKVDCGGDAKAGAKIIWNFMHRWQGFGANAHFRYTYWDRGEQLPLRYAGTTSAWILKYRPEPQFEAENGDVFAREQRYAVVGFEVNEPREFNGTRTLTYRYAKSFGPLAIAQPEDTWIYLREIRRIRKVSQKQRSAAISGTDFTFDDLFTFSGLPAQYHWKCLGYDEVLAPMNTQHKGYPYEEEARYGSSGLSYANDRWELRRAIKLEMVPKQDDHPYARKELWLDVQTMQPLYSFAYDHTGALYKIIYHNHRWSEDDLGDIKARDWYPAWENVPEPRDLRVVSEAIMNVQTGTGNRLDFWDSNGSPPKLRSLRRYAEVQRLRQGR